MKPTIASLLKKHIPLKEKEIESLIELPKALEMGDYSLPCFALSKKLKKSPHKIAEELSSKIKKLPKGFDSVEAVNGYLNFHADKNSLAKNIVEQILKQKDNFGKSKNNKNKTMVEFSQPNTHLETPQNTPTLNITNIEATNPQPLQNLLTQLTHTNNLQNHHIYICGPTPFKKTITNWAKQNNIPKTHIHHENFNYFADDQTLYPILKTQLERTTS